jgi:hypothetical protein
MAVHEFKNCRYCADEIDQQYLARHEEKCKSLTSEERQTAKLTRERARNAYRTKHKISAATNGTRERYRASMAVPSNGKSKSDHRHATTACRYCHQPIDIGWLDRHEAACQKRTPEERAAENKKRAGQREYYRSWYRAQRAAKRGVPAVAKNGNGRVARRHQGHSLFTNGSGKRLSATISIDFKSFREVLLQLAPMLSIDKVEVL